VISAGSKSGVFGKGGFELWDAWADPEVEMKWGKGSFSIWKMGGCEKGITPPEDVSRIDTDVDVDQQKVGRKRFHPFPALRNSMSMARGRVGNGKS